MPGKEKDVFDALEPGFDRAKEERESRAAITTTPRYGGEPTYDVFVEPLAVGTLAVDTETMSYVGRYHTVTEALSPNVTWGDGSQWRITNTSPLMEYLEARREERDHRPGRITFDDIEEASPDTDASQEK